MLAPTLLASAPYKSPTAFADLTGQLEFMFRDIAAATFRLTGETIRVEPIGVGGTKAWMLALTDMVSDACSHLGISGPPPSLSTYDLETPQGWQGWTFAVSQQMERLRVAAGLP